MEPSFRKTQGQQGLQDVALRIIEPTDDLEKEKSDSQSFRHDVAAFNQQEAQFHSLEIKGKES